MKFTFYRAQDVVRKPIVYPGLFTLHTAAYANHKVAIPILHVKYRAQLLFGVWWGDMYWVYITLSCHNWKRSDFRYNGAYFIY